MTTTDRLLNKPGVNGATIITRSGIYFDFLDPKPEMISIYDIAWGLSMICRFGGQSTSFYSVAQHSCLVSRLVPEEHQFAALMHDAVEAYVGDMVGPLKQLIPEYKVIEKRAEAVVLGCWGITLPLDPCIKHADLRALRTEQRDLTVDHESDWNGLDQYEAWSGKIIPQFPQAAAAMFTDYYHRLGGPDRKVA
jgi:hypothetical protein